MLELSKETNSLSGLKQTTIGILTDGIKEDLNMGIKDQKVSPVSGYEPPFEPEYWHSEMIKRKRNCYAYALNYKDDVSTEHLLKVGQPSGTGYDKDDVNTFISALYSDAEALGMKLIPVAFEDKCPEGMYKIAVFIESYHCVINGKKQIGLRDYHFYRQNPDGTWSHKRPCGEISCKDKNNEYILNPETYSKNYVYKKYDMLIGYFAVTRKAT